MTIRAGLTGGPYGTGKIGPKLQSLPRYEQRTKGNKRKVVTTRFMPTRIHWQLDAAVL